MKGFVSPLVVLLFLVFGLAVLFVAISGPTGFINRAGSNYQSWPGVISENRPCVRKRFCFSLATGQGETFYLDTQEKDGINLGVYKDLSVIVYGTLVGQERKAKYILVTRVQRDY